ncbi:hypothetical protein HW555_014030 [Spodoptera exigua]|uniref:Uncharacterized protein n=1 Tax=Spodoptera exigua TaxID=7107 RepID=A0A835G4I1_SPOEX|nr:hypothetical protein HW555_014030 [Spodoptera exigua]
MMTYFDNLVVSPLCPGGQDAVACAPGAVFGQRKPTLPAGKRSSQTSLPGAMGSSVLSLAQLNPRAPCTRPAPARHTSLHGLTLLTVKVDGTKRISGGLSTVSLNALQRLLPASSAAQDHFPLSNLSASVTPSTDIRRPSASSDTVRVQMSLKPDFSLNVVLTYLVVPLKFILTLSLYHVKAMFGDPYAIQIKYNIATKRVIKHLVTVLTCKLSAGCISKCVEVGRRRVRAEARRASAARNAGASRLELHTRTQASLIPSVVVKLRRYLRLAQVPRVAGRADTADGGRTHLSADTLLRELILPASAAIFTHVGGRGTQRTHSAVRAGVTIETRTNSLIILPSIAVSQQAALDGAAGGGPRRLRGRPHLVRHVEPVHGEQAQRAELCAFYSVQVQLHH